MAAQTSIKRQRDVETRLLIAELGILHRAVRAGASKSRLASARPRAKRLNYAPRRVVFEASSRLLGDVREVSREGAKAQSERKERAAKARPTTFGQQPKANSFRRIAKERRPLTEEF